MPIKPKGRTPEYSQAKADKYIKYMKRTKCSLTKAAEHIGHDVHTIVTWSRLKRNPFHAAYKKAKELQRQWLEDGLKEGTIHPSAGIFLLKCNHKYIEHDKDQH